MVSGYARGEAPGQAWSYNDFGIQLLARSLEKIFQQSLDAACRERLAMLQFEDGAIFGSRHGLGVEASPRDFARIGWLWLNRGQWKGGRTVIEEKLFARCVRPGVPAGLPRTSVKGEDYLLVGSFGGGADQRGHGPGVYGFNFWFNERLSNGERVWPAAPADTFQANGHWNRNTVTMFPSLGMVVVMRGAHAGEFEPGIARGRYNQNLKRLMDAVQTSSDPGRRRKKASLRSQRQAAGKLHGAITPPIVPTAGAHEPPPWAPVRRN
jgi:CubicO group peptidase (beta-lactamase class C family)